jgi:L-amino acid N-acyltransferase YncA
MIIRPASPDDLPGILTIYNDVIATSTAIYAPTPASLEDRRAWFDGRQAQGYPVLVAADFSDIRGFASFGDFRAGHGYRFTVEHSVHVASGHRGGGIGRKLVEALFPLATALGKHVMVGGIDAANTASIAFHARLGFEQVAHFREVGHKFGRWLDLVLMQRMLDTPGAPRG